MTEVEQVGEASFNMEARPGPGISTSILTTCSSTLNLTYLEIWTISEVTFPATLRITLQTMPKQLVMDLILKIFSMHRLVKKNVYICIYLETTIVVPDISYKLVFN